LEKGVPEEDIFKDHAGFSTYESIYRAKVVFGAEKVVIVTQKYHIYRALYIAKSLGLDAVGVASDPRAYRGELYRQAREYAARVKDFGMCLFKPLPTYLGELIPISGDGRMTEG
ncbi:MAG: vancomycin high temperature exclusion protein, partial [Eubacteriales bacterium]